MILFKYDLSPEKIWDVFNALLRITVAMQVAKVGISDLIFNLRE